MPDKDDFTFDDNEDFPETDLSSAFEESEHHAPPEPDPEPKTGKGGAKTRPLLLVLLLVIAFAGGAYYFMGLGETAPEVTKAPAKAQKTVSLPPKPAKAPAPQSAAKSVEAKLEVAQAAVPAPPPAKETAKAGVSAEKPVASEPPEVKTVDTLKMGTSTEVSPSPPPAKVTVAETVAKTAPKKVAVATTAPQLQAVLPAAVKGTYALDAGSYLFASNSKKLEKKIRSLGYEPLVTPVDAKVAMIRLRLGTFQEAEAQEALSYAKTISPASFTLRQNDQYVLYAGTFINEHNADLLQEKFLLEGIVAEKEPVEVTRTLSRLRFGSFPTFEAATEAAGEAEAAGLESKVVKF